MCPYGSEFSMFSGYYSLKVSEGLNARVGKPIHSSYPFESWAGDGRLDSNTSGGENVRKGYVKGYKQGIQGRPQDEDLRRCALFIKQSSRYHRAGCGWAWL